MFRKNPDAIALAVIGFALFVTSIPRMVVNNTHWAVTPLNVEVRAHQDEVRAVRDQIQCQRDEIRRQVMEHKDEIRAAADQIRTAVHE